MIYQHIPIIMYTAITHNIKISVKSFYHGQQSNPLVNRYIHAYHVQIENLSPETVQLINRHWIIVDSNGVTREVEGEGVIGRQPTVTPGQLHSYTSWAPLASDIGKMYGTFTMRRVADDSLFEVEIPVFKLIAPFKQN